MHDLNQLTREVLQRGYLVTLAVQDDNGVWAADVIYIFDEDLNFYWMSKPERRHSKAIDDGHNHVAGAIAVTQGPEMPDEGLQISGVAQRVQNPSDDLLKQWMKKMQRAFDSGLGIVLDEHVWYKLVPDRIELIYQKLFEYERQRVR